MKKTCILLLLLGCLFISCLSFNIADDKYESVKYDPEMAYVFLRSDYIPSWTESAASALAMTFGEEALHICLPPSDEPQPNVRSMEYPEGTMLADMPIEDTESLVIIPIKPGSYRIGYVLGAGYTDVTKYAKGYLDIEAGEVVYLGDHKIRILFDSDMRTYWTEFKEREILNNFDKTTKDLQKYNPNFQGLKYLNHLAR